MRNVDLIKKIDTNVDEILEIQNIPEFDKNDYDLNEPKEVNKYLDRVEKRVVRSSFEYRAFTRFIKKYMAVNKCSFFSNITNAENYKIHIELHHEPFTLYDIVSIVYNKRFAHRQSVEENEVAKEVMWLHYNLWVGLIPLSKTVHLLVGNNYISIPLNYVMGNWQKFADVYNDFIDNDLKDKLSRSIEFTKTYNDGSVDNEILKQKFIYLNTSDAYDTPKYKDILNYLNKSLNDIQRRTEEKQLQAMENNYSNNEEEIQRVPLFVPSR